MQPSILSDVFGLAIARASIDPEECQRLMSIEEVTERLRGSALLASGHVMFDPRLGLEPVHRVSSSLLHIPMSQITLHMWILRYHPAWKHRPSHSQVVVRNATRQCH